MKELLLLRHAKSSRKIKSIEDRYRPLNKRGYNDIRKVCIHALSRETIDVDAVICSPSIRTYSTAVLAMPLLGLNETPLLIEPSLYRFNMNHETLFELLSKNYEQYSRILLVGHNETFLHLVEHLTHGEIKKYPTSAFSKFSSESNTWKAFASSQHSLDFIFSPKDT